MESYSVLSTVEVPFKVTASNFDGTPYTFGSDVVQIALVLAGTSPTPTDFKTATWATTTPGAGVAVILVGPNGGVFTAQPAFYDGWVKVTDNPEIPVILAGKVSFF